MQWRNAVSRSEFQGLFPWCHGSVTSDAFDIQTFLNTAEDQLGQFAETDSPVAWQNPKTFGESEVGQPNCIPWRMPLSQGRLLHVTPRYPVARYPVGQFD
jgi:hypothetical protein